MKPLCLFVAVLLLVIGFALRSQTTFGIGLYPTGTEAGFGFRLAKDSRLTWDARLAKAAVYNDHSKASGFITENSLVWRIVMLDKVRFAIGLGLKNEWNLNSLHKHGLVVPLGVEAFPFPFQNAGIFFEAAPYYVEDLRRDYTAGIRTAGGFIFYFPVKNKKTI